MDSALALAAARESAPSGFHLENLVAMDLAIWRATRGDIKHLRTFLERHDNAVRAILLTAEPYIRTLAPRVISAPWWAVL